MVGNTFGVLTATPNTKRKPSVTPNSDEPCFSILKTKREPKHQYTACLSEEVPSITSGETTFQFPLAPVVTCIAKQMVLPVKPKEVTSMKHELTMAIFKATGVAYAMDGDCEAIQQIMNFLAPQQKRVDGWIGWEAALVDYMQNLRGGKVKSAIIPDILEDEEGNDMILWHLQSCCRITLVCQSVAASRN